jgi:hypothetical protein
MGNIGSHVDLTSWRRGHQAKPASAMACRHPPRDQAAHQGPGRLGLLVAKGISQQKTGAVPRDPRDSGLAFPAHVGLFPSGA